MNAHACTHTYTRAYTCCHEVQDHGVRVDVDLLVVLQMLQDLGSHVPERAQPPSHGVRVRLCHMRRELAEPKVRNLIVGGKREGELLRVDTSRERVIGRNRRVV